MRVIEVGDKLPSIDLLITYKSECSPIVLFWEDPGATVPSDLSNVLDCFVEVYVDPLTTLVWPAGNSDNSITVTLSEADTTVEWESRPFNLIFMKPLRNVVLSGEVQVQR